MTASTRVLMAVHSWLIRKTGKKKSCFVLIFPYSWISLTHQYMYSKGTGSDEREAWKISLLAWGVNTCDHSSGSVRHRMMCSELCCWILFLPWLSKRKVKRSKKKNAPEPFALSVILNRGSRRNKGSKLYFKFCKCMLIFCLSMQTSDTIKKKVLLLTVVFAMQLSYRTCSDMYFFLSLNSWCVPVWSQPHLSAVNRRLWRRRWKRLCARAQSDLVEGFGYRLKIKPAHLTFAADS